MNSPDAPRIPDHELLRRIGTGSYGDVWLARSVTGQWRAVKVVHRSRFDRDKPYEREFAGLKKFEPVSRGHDSQVDILHVGRDDAAEFFYYVMELADDETAGQQIDPARYSPKTLRAELQRLRQLPAAECVRLGISLATALEHLHGSGLVHRDVKPSNIIFIAGEPKLADIGLVTGLEATRSFVGTEGYLPPEGPGTPSADLYALGKVLYEAAFGRDRLDFPEVPTMLGESPERAQLLEMNEIVLKCCASDPQERYRDGASLRADLERLQRGQSVKQRRDLARTARFTFQMCGVVLLLVALGFTANFFLQHKPWRADEPTRGSNPPLVVSELPVVTPRVPRPKALREEPLIQTGSLSEAAAWLADAVRTNRSDARTAARRLVEVLSARPFLIPHLPPLTHGTEIYDLAFSPDGHRLAVSATARPVQFLDLISGKSAPLDDPRVPRFQGLMRYSPDGRRLLVSCPTLPSSFYIVDTVAGALLRAPNTGGTGLVRAEFLPDGRRFVAAGIGGVRMWDAETAEQVALLMPMTNSLRHLAVSADGRWALAVADTGTTTRAMLVDVVAQKEIHLTGLDAERVTVGWFSPDSTRLLAGGPGSSGQLLELATGRQLTPPFTHHDAILSGAWMPDGRRVLTGSRDTTARLWDAATGGALSEPLPHHGLVLLARPSPDGRFIATGADSFIRLWRGADGKQAVMPIRHAADATRVAFSGDGRLMATGARDGSVIVWRLPTASEMGRDPATLAVVQNTLRALEKNPAPSWLPDLAEELAGRAVGGPNHLAQFTGRSRYAEARRAALAAEPADAFTRWARWLLQEPAAGAGR